MDSHHHATMVPGFILKLWKMINDPQCDDLIAWSDNGQSFIIVDPPRFSQELSKYFKHNNLSSFIRQLNMYGFRKVATTEDLHFFHHDFVKNKPERLEAIKRKLPQKTTENVDLKNIVHGLNELEDKQKDVTKSLSDIKRENNMLWAELHDLRQKHQQQEHYINRLMKLVFDAIKQNNIRTTTLQFEGPLMIEGGDNNNLTSETENITIDQQHDNHYQQEQQQQFMVASTSGNQMDKLPEGCNGGLFLEYQTNRNQSGGLEELPNLNVPNCDSETLEEQINMLSGEDCFATGDDLQDFAGIGTNNDNFLNMLTLGAGGGDGLSANMGIGTPSTEGQLDEQQQHHMDHTIGQP